ncbi:glyceraldehyde-3-phosphate dehydrogenase [Nocardioides sp. Kera G14]|uniref:glyceraldehyde-3-phosphate dehydrogenase n=1 Tax=Nocardioides sp. Kera G14 TaxID=2884264 RepID=UPI001D0FB9F4|nr:glyceraldehyde-3-phosphate dehydrogenase [Nocardioides sp. Kera G14]UDY24958.1 glyceraldehyde-3-phosphate dehydrogenase [Nocardioides sp. Kera G14]
MTQDHFSDWQHAQELAEAMIPIVGRLYRERDVTIRIHSRSLVNKSAIDVLRTHRFVRHIEGYELSIDDTSAILQAVAALDLGAATIDIGRLAVAYAASDEGLSVEEYVARELADATGENKLADVGGKDVVLYGFGRIGRLVARLLVEKAGSGNGLRLRAVVVRKGGENDLVKRASLFRRDSIHGHFNGSITIDEENSTIIANGNAIRFIYASDPSDVDYTAYGINDAILIDNTGRWRDREGLSQHLRPGVDKVVLTAPGKGDIPNIVHGVNHEGIDPAERILSCASCTTNAVVPAIKAMEDAFGIRSGHVETVHSFTNDQNLLDNYHKADRRGRSAPLNLVIVETGAASAIKKALPNLEATISGNAIRVPTPDVSMAVLNLNLKQATTRDEVFATLRQASLEGPLKRAIDFTSAADAVSTDFIGSRAATVVDGNALIVNDDNAILYLWYDNEFGYSTQVLRVIQQISGVEYPELPKS